MSENEDETTLDAKFGIVGLERGHRFHWLAQLKGPGAPCEHELQGEEWVVGRSSNVAISINSGLLSRKHMRLFRDENEVRCEDLQSMNGVYLNGVKVHSAILRDGDTIQLGDVVFTFHEGGE